MARLPATVDGANQPARPPIRPACCHLGESTTTWTYRLVYSFAVMIARRTRPVPPPTITAFLLVALSLLAPERSAAQAAAPAVPLDYVEASGHLRDAHESLKAADLLVRQRREEREAAKGIYWPKVTFGATAVQLDAPIEMSVPVGGLFKALPIPIPPSAIPGPLGLELQAIRFAEANVSARLLLYTGGKAGAANRAAEDRITEAEMAARREAAALGTELARRYFGLQVRERQRAVRQEALGLLDRLQGDARKLEQEGLIAKTERLAAEVAHAEGERQLRAAESDIAIARVGLASLLSQPDTGPLTSPLFVVRDVEPVERFTATVETAHPAVAQVRALEAQAEQGVRAQRGAFKPDVFLFANQVVAQADLSDLVPRGIYGVGASWTIFDGPERHKKLAAAELQVQRAQALRARAVRDLAALVEVKYREMLKARDQFDTLGRSIELAEENIRVRTLAFREGLATTLEVVDAQVQLSKARIERAAAAYQFDVALAEMLEASGQAERFDEYRRRGEEVREP